MSDETPFLDERRVDGLLEQLKRDIFAATGVGPRELDPDDAAATVHIGKYVRRLRDERGWEAQDLADAMNQHPGDEVSPHAIYKREQGRLRIRPDWRRRFAKAFGMSLAKFDEGWRSMYEIPRTRGGQGIPVINRTAAGLLMDSDEHGTDSGQGFEYIEASDVEDDLAFAVVVEGDSMTPRLLDGDVCVCVPIHRNPRAPEWQDGDVVYFRIVGEGGGIARVKTKGVEKGSVVFTKDNPRYSPLRFGLDEVEQLAKVVEIRTKHV